MAGDGVERMRGGARDARWTPDASVGVARTDNIIEPKDTLEMMQLMAGTE